jgi:hypothetical protein
MKTKLTLTTLLLTNLAFADLPPKPIKCPTATVIAQTGVDPEAKQDLKGQWYANSLHQRYDTEDNWDFIIGFIIATDKNDAYKKATAALSTLNLTRGPFYSPRRGWTCLYSTEPGYLAATTIS